MKITAKIIHLLSLRFCLVLLFAVACLCPVRAQVSQYGDITIQVESPQVTGVGSGYGEYRALVANDSATRSHRVTVALQVAPYGSSTQGVKEVRREVELAPRSKAAVSVFLPMLEMAYSAAVVIDGERQRDEAKINNPAGFLDTGDRNFGLLLSPQVFKSGLANGNTFEKAFKDADGKKLVATQSYETPVAGWSANWLSFARYDGIVVTGGELNSAPEAVRTALLRYVERGGALMVIGAWQVPAQWQARQGFITNDAVNREDDDDSEKDSDDSSSSARPQTKGEDKDVLTITVAKESFPSAAPRSKSSTDLRVFFIGFGTLTVTGAVDSGRITANQWAWVGQNFRATRLPGSDFYTLAELNRYFKVVERYGVPARGLFALMLLFVIVIGPINLIWLARRKRKIWLLWTVPAVSLMTCLAVAGFAMFGEGWSATARTEALTILDETAHRATTIGWTAFYSPITPSEGLHFSQDTEIAPQLPEGLYYHRNNTERTIDWTNDQHLDSGWITARVPAFFKFRKSEPRRERLNIRQEPNGSATLVNGLGVEISQVWWADSNGKIHSATNIPAGSQAVLKATELKATAWPSTLRAVFGKDWLTQFKALGEQPQAALMPNSYLAVLNACPFVEEGLKNVKTRQARNLVYGLTGGGTQ